MHTKFSDLRFRIFYINNICSPYGFRFSLGNLTTEILKALEKCKIYLITGIGNLMKKAALVVWI